MASIVLVQAEIEEEEVRKLRVVVEIVLTGAG